MNFCPRCGARTGEGDQFCSMCGASFSQASVRDREAYEGRIHKCPSCGQALNALSVVCPSCGYELRDTSAALSLRELSARLQEITSHPNKGVKQTLIERLRRDATDVDDQAAALIKAFPIPNTREDLIEFIITSAANINVDAFNEMRKGGLSSSDIAMSHAWLSQLEQAYQKASIVLSGEESFEKVKVILPSRNHDEYKSPN